MSNKLDASVPANNWKIIELYNKIRKEELNPSPNFQRKLVWKKSHKYNFIQTILMNYPFPEIYIAPGELDTESLILRDLIVDGQQRCTTIINYIEDKDVFSLDRVSVRKFSDLSNSEKSDFLNYEVSIRYMKNADQEQIKEIFQRINSTEYSLNSSERMHAQWGESEFIVFAKQMIEEDEFLDFENISYKLDDENRGLFFNVFSKVFSENDLKRMLALQYLLTLITTIIEGKYFRRNDNVQDYIERYHEEFKDASYIEVGLSKVINFINELDLGEGTYWYNKANLFTLIVELSKYSIESINKKAFRDLLLDIENEYKSYKDNPSDFENIELIKYFDFAKEGVNEIPARNYRGDFIEKKIRLSIS